MARPLIIDGQCAECLGTVLAHATSGAERGSCHCWRGPGRIVAHLMYDSPNHPGGTNTYGVEWDGVEQAVSPPTLPSAVTHLSTLRDAWWAAQDETHADAGVPTLYTPDN